MKLTTLRPLAAAALTAAMALPLATGIAAAAASPDEFNAPMLGTTATLTEARMPTYDQVTCSDARCTRGAIPNAQGGATMYSSPSIALGGAFATAPGFLAKLNKSWSNITRTNTRDYSTMTINFAQFAPGTDLAATVAANALTIDATLSAPETVGDTTIWTGSSDKSDAKWTIVYVAKGDEIARGVCLQYGTEKGSATCPLANVKSLAQSVISTPPASTLSGVSSVASLIPNTPRRLTPVLLNIEPAQPLWAENVPGTELNRALAARRNSVALQYSVTGQPQLLFRAKVGALSSTAPARPFVKTICESSVASKATCTLTRIPGPAYGYIGAWTSDEHPKDISSLSMHFTGAKRLGDASCSLLGAHDRGLTPAEMTACRAALVSFATATVG